MARVGFRARLFLILAAFAILPSLLLTVVFGGLVVGALPRLTAAAAWQRVAETGRRTIMIAERQALTPADSATVRAHTDELSGSLQQSMRFSYLASRAWPIVVATAVLALILWGAIASRVAGHLSRQLSRPLRELIGWAELIGRGEPLPEVSSGRGAPEFDLMRARMRRLAHDLARARAREIDAARLRAYQESASRVAHELKNPLTPIRFAVERLAREAPPHLADTVQVIAVESQRIEAMARSFSQFGRMPEGPAAEVDIGELVRYATRAAVPDRLPVTIVVDDALPPVHGHHDALARAFTNVLLNAVDACQEGGTVAVHASAGTLNHAPAVEIAVRDTGSGIAADRLERIWEPYVTYKAGGTGLGLAIARQTILAHHGDVRARSRAGEGTEIVLIIPAGDGAKRERGDAWPRS